jgi:hypothetical protein
MFRRYLEIYVLQINSCVFPQGYSAPSLTIPVVVALVLLFSQTEYFGIIFDGILSFMSHILQEITWALLSSYVLNLVLSSSSPAPLLDQVTITFYLDNQNIFPISLCFRSSPYPILQPV